MSYRTPAEIGQVTVNIGVAKANTAAANLVVLGILAGSFIAIAAIASNTASSALGPWAGLGAQRFVSSIVFGIGIVMVVVGGAELFTGNTLMVAALYDRRITIGQLLRNWCLVYLSNFLGAILVAVIYYASGLWRTADGSIVEGLVATAAKKIGLDFWQAFFRGILCNWLVCMGIWMSYVADDVTGKILPTAWAVATFIIIGAEHSVANMFYIPMGFMLWPEAVPVGQAICDALRNIFPVTLGNIVGGSVLVATMYWVAYIRRKSSVHDQVKA